MRRIVHYYPDALGSSGVTSALWAWARAQAANGHEVTVLHTGIGSSNDRPAFVKTQGDGLPESRPVPHRGRHRHLRHPIGLGRWLGKNDLLVLHEGWVPSNAVAAAAARRAGVPYLVVPHGVYDRLWRSYLKPPLRLRMRFERRVLEGAAAVHFFFRSESRDVEDLAPRSALLVAPTGFELPPERWAGGGGYISWLGRIDPYAKGLDLLADAMALLPSAERPRVWIRGYGYKDGLQRLRQDIRRRGVDGSIEIGPPCAGAEKQTFLRNATGYVHPSRWECHSIALLENLSLGVPSIASSAIHIAPHLAEAGAALLSAPRAEPLAEALLALASGPDGMGERGRRFVAEGFAWPNVMQRFEAELSRLGLN